MNNDDYSTLLYQTEVSRFLAPFDGQKDGKSPKEKVLEIYREQVAKIGKDVPLTEHEKKFGLLHPAVIAEKLARGMDLPGKDGRLHDRIDEIIAKTYPIDPMTEFYTKQTMPVTVGLAHLYARQQDSMPVCLVEGDFTNMAGCNVHFDKKMNGGGGRQTTDKLIHEITALVRDTFSTHVRQRGGEVVAMRSGGDETRLIVYGLGEEQVNAILNDEIHPKINLLAAKFGVHHAEHTKNRLPGFGASYACVDLKTVDDPEKVRSELDTAISYRKYNDAWMRYGLNRHEGLVGHVTKNLIPDLRDKGYSEEEISRYLEGKKAALLEQDEALRQEWQRLKSKGGAYHQIILDGFMKSGTASEFYDDYAAAHKDRISSDLERIKIPGPAASADVIPFHHVEVPQKELEDPDITRLRRALREFGFDNAADADIYLRWNRRLGRRELPPDMQEQDPRRKKLQQFVVDLMEAFHAPDPSTHTKSASLMAEDAKDYIGKFGDMKVLQFEVTNLSGMNKVSTHLADAVLRETGKYLRKALIDNPDSRYLPAPEHMADHLYYEGNGRFKVFVPGDYRGGKALERELRELFAEHVLEQNIEDFARKTFARPLAPPRKPSKDASATALAGYEEALNAYHIRQGQRERLLEDLEQNMHVTGIEFENIINIPHPRKDNKIGVGIRFYGNGIIRRNEPAAEGLSRISREATEAFANSHSLQR